MRLSHPHPPPARAINVNSGIPSSFRLSLARTAETAEAVLLFAAAAGALDERYLGAVPCRNARAEAGREAGREGGRVEATRGREEGSRERLLEVCMCVDGEGEGSERSEVRASQRRRISKGDQEGGRPASSPCDQPHEKQEEGDGGSGGEGGAGGGG